MKYCNALFLFILVISCGVTSTVDYDSYVDFTECKTYNYQLSEDIGLSELDEKRVINALDEAMNTKGLSYSETPDVYINFYAATYDNSQQNTVGVGVGGGSGGFGGGVSVGIPIKSSKYYRQLVIDMIDASTNKLIWQAVTESSYNANATPEKREAQLQAVVEKALENYPPKK